LVDPGLDDTHQQHLLSDARLSRQGHVSHESEVVLSSNSRKSETQRVQDQLSTLLHCCIVALFFSESNVPAAETRSHLRHWFFQDNSEVDLFFMCPLWVDIHSMPYFARICHLCKSVPNDKL